MDDQLIALYNRHVGTAFDRQMRLEAFLTKKNAGGEMEYETSTGRLSFGKVTFEAPILGTHALHNNSWLWAWSNKHIKLSITNRALGDAVRALVHRLNLHALGAPGFALEPLLGPKLTESAVHILGVILAAELGYDAYFTIPHDGVIELVLIRDDRLKFTEKHPLVRIATQFPALPGSMPVPDHKAALTAYARDYALTVTEEPGILKITAGGKDVLTATFDAEGQLAKMEGVALPEPTPVKKAAKKQPTAKKKPAAKAVAKKPAAKLAKKPAAKAKPPVAKAGKKLVTATKPVAKKPTKKPAGKK